MSDSTLQGSPEGIAVIGMSGRFPGARNIDDFWRNLCDGVESIAFFSNQELEESGFNVKAVDLPNFVRSGRILDNVEGFDAAFFGYTPREAELMDPQHRLFLECAWEALEHAGYDSERCNEWIGVYGGVALNGYLLYNLFLNPEIREFMELVGAVQGAIANDRDYVTTRVSYKLNLKGPSFNVQSACSTALVAVHLACQGLLNYQCDMALAGGASVRVPHKAGYLYQEGGMLSPDGHCRTFDALAQGTVFGSGAGIVVLKRLSDALADGDTIYAVIKGTAINNDGAVKIGFTAPSVDGQAEVVAMAQGMAGVAPETVSFVEAHGTATPLGDPIEVAALTKVFRAGTQKKQFCAIGSVKTNIGHASAAAGVAGLIKTALALKHRLIPPSLHFETPNPKIDFANSPFYVNTELTEWPSNGTPRRAGVSSFGVGGTNAHIVLEEAPWVAPSGPARPWQLLVISARTEPALEAATTNLIEYLERNPDLDLADAAYTLQVGRRSFNQRRILVCRDHDDAIRTLAARDPKRVLNLAREQRDRPVMFLFSGQGAQYVNMARELYETEPVFREVVDRCAELLAPHLGLDLRDLLYPDLKIEDRRWKIEDTEASILYPLSSILDLDQTQYTQPALFVVEYALARLWMAWGVQPQAMIGHSIGEYVAACLAGVFSLEDALALVATRGRLMQQMPHGAMLMVPLPEQEVQALLNSQLSLAAINGPSRCVVVGPSDAVDALEQRLTEIGVTCRRLHTSHAFHSWMMEPVVEPFTRHVQRVRLQAPQIPYLSNLTGTWIKAEEATDPRYWARHLRQPVRFADGVGELFQKPNYILLEVGPGQTLTTLARQHPKKDASHTVLASTRHPQDAQSDVAFLLNTLGQLWLAGLPIEWPKLYAHERRRRVPLPTYPFERQNYWVAPLKPEELAKTQRGSLHKKPDIADWFYIPSWKRSIPPIGAPGDPIEPASCWLIFGDPCGIGARLAQRLEHAGQEVVSVTAGEQFAQLGERAYTLNPRRPDDYDALLDSLRASQPALRMIVHLWSITPADQPHSDAAAPDQSEALNFYSLLFLAQALGRQPAGDPIQIRMLSNNMQKVAGEPALCPEKALLLGPCKVIPAEYPNLSCQSIDIVLPRPGSLEEQELIDQLLAEFGTPSADSVIAYRGYDRWVQTYEAVRLDEAIAGKTRLRPGGVYLITGGLGGIGLALAEYLAQETQAKLVLTGRSAFPDREAWGEWLATHDEQDATSRKIRKLRQLEELGADVLVVRADVVSEADMQRAIAQACEAFGALHGVIHSAGIAGGGMIQLKTPEVAARVLAPKIEALRVFERVLATVDLDFLLLCSSTTSILGGIGQVDYCAANAVLDAYAQYNTSMRGVPTIAINWDAWQDVGMAVDVAASYGLLGGAPATRQKELAHPLLDRCLQKTASQEIYATEFSVANQWALAEHKIMGTSVLPGTAYLEMARATFETRAADDLIELREILFLTPLMLGDDARAEVHTTLEGAGDAVDFRIASRSAFGSGADSVWQEHVRGKLARMSRELPKRYAIADLREKCSVREVTVTAEEIERIKKFAYWGPRWRTIKTIYLGKDEGMAFLELPEEFSADLQEFVIHPALLDAATAFASAFATDGGNYLPLSYDRLRVLAPLSQKIYSYARYKGGSAAKKETISFDITILDEQGQALIEIEDFTMKLVNESIMKLGETIGQTYRKDGAAGDGAALPYEHVDADQAVAPAGKGTPLNVGMSSSEGVEAFKRILSRNKLPQIVVSTQDLHVVIEQINTLKQERILAEIDKVQHDKPRHPRPAMQTSYVAPRSELERRLAEIWQRAIGMEQVGIHDNFFEIGGDSVLGIQSIAMAREVGIELTPAQLFQHQTIAELAAIIDPGQASAIDLAPASASVPLTPVQHWFFEQDPPDPRSWSQALLLELQTPVEPIALGQAVQHVLASHDALRLRFRRAEDAWEQRIAAVEAYPVFSSMDLSTLPEAERELTIPAIAADLRASLNLAEGPLLRIALLDFGADTPGRLLVVVHQLAVDLTSWRIVIEDLWSAYEQISRGAAVTLPRRTATFKRWAERLVEYARAEITPDERDYWLSALDAPGVPLPLDDRVPAANPEAVARKLTVALDTAATHALLEELPQAHHFQPEDVLLTALVEAFAQWTGARALLLDLESHRRTTFFDDTDLSRMVGRCTTIFPLRVDLSADFEPGKALMAVKELRQAVPNYGIGYGALRYLSDDASAAAQLGALPQPELRFSYLGRIDQVLPAAAPFRLADDSTGPHRSPGGRRYTLEIEGRVVADQLQIEWTYGEHSHRSTTIEQLAQNVLAALRVLIAHCRSSEVSSYTPSDFPEAGLSQEALDKFLTRVRKRSR